MANRLRGLPLVTRWVVVGAGSLGLLGGIIGRIVGLHASAPTGRRVGSTEGMEE
jgi:hypothetical protein